VENGSSEDSSAALETFIKTKLDAYVDAGFETESAAKLAQGDVFMRSPPAGHLVDMTWLFLS